MRARVPGRCLDQTVHAEIATWPQPADDFGSAGRVQAVTFQIFYGSHLDIVSRRLSAAIAGEIALTARVDEPFSRQTRP